MNPVAVSLEMAKRVAEITAMSAAILARKRSDAIVDAACIVRGYAELIWAGEWGYLAKLELAIYRMAHTP